MKILDSIIKFGSAFSSLTTVGKYAVVGAAVFFVSYGIGKSNGEDKYAQFKAEYEEYRKTATSAVIYSNLLKTQVDSLQSVSNNKDSTIKKLTVSISFNLRKRDELRTEFVELESRLTNQGDTAILVAVQDTVIQNLKQQVAVSDTIIIQKDSIIVQKTDQVNLLTQALTLSETRGDSLTKVLEALPKAPNNPNKWFFGLIPKPSRTVVGVVSFVGGVVIASSIGR